jgi:hypothetical protein
VKFPPPLLSDQPRGIQIFLVVVLPIAFGALCGLFLGLNELIYLIASLLGIAGGYFAGFDHVGAGPGARRGFVGGLLFGASILIAHEIHGEDAKAELPDPEILLVVLTTVLGIALGALGGRARAKREEQTAEA